MNEEENKILTFFSNHPSFRVTMMSYHSSEYVDEKRARKNRLYLDLYLDLYDNRWLDEQKKLANVSPESPV